MGGGPGDDRPGISPTTIVTTPRPSGIPGAYAENVSAAAPVAPPGPTARRIAAPIAVGVAAATGCIALAVLDPSDRGPVICPFRALTGLDCPGCGMTRAVSHVVRGQVGTAVDYNALMVLAVPVALYLYLTWLASLWGRRLPPLRLGPRATAVVIAAGVGFAVVRNLPFGPGRYLNSDPGRL